MLEYEYQRPGSFLKKHEIMLLLVIRVLKSAEKLCKTYLRIPNPGRPGDWGIYPRTHPLLVEG